MTKRNQIYKCEVCGHIIQVMDKGSHPVCCNQKMTYMEEDTQDAALEKHVPEIEKIDGGYKVFVGKVEHPMGEDHYIEWIQLLTESRVYTKFLKPGDKPEAIFKLDCDKVWARAYCNLHGNWKKEL